MSTFIDLTGQKFGNLTVVEVDKTVKNGRTNWKCLCKCGKYTTVPTYRLRAGETISCGCRRYETKNQTHGMKHTRIYETWCGMKKRCYNKNEKSYSRYGGRGITVCEEWKNDFLEFYNWSMGNGYAENLTIDRIDNEKGYCPENCRWVTRTEQQRNKTNNIYLEINGERKTIAEWSAVYGCSDKLAYERYHRAVLRGQQINEKEIFAPPKDLRKKVNQYTLQGDFVKTWDCANRAEVDGFSADAIGQCCLGKSKTSGGYIWKYAGE